MGSYTKVIYVAGAFRAKPDPNDQWQQTFNIRKAENAAWNVWAIGGVALCPHLNTRNFQGSLPDDIWLKGDMELLARCDAIFMVPGWEASTGATAERAFAVERGLVALDTQEDLRKYLEE